ncbi:hypothetical protein RUM43_001858 [Polyplax serrata]|uniref:t-SNARE coiled-coil homology domain-containing protein n=1 Tax=Polyplax serrata TaxID=468196 RepID=A0AAN8XSV9_POLSC
MDLIDTGTDPWIVEYESCEKVAWEIMENLNLRDVEKSSTQTYDALSAKIRIRLKQFGSEVNELKRKLNCASVASSLTPEERERRQRQVELLLTREAQLQDQFNQRKKNENYNSKYSESRDQLMGKANKKSVFADQGTSSWGDIAGTEGGDFNSRSIDEMKEEQQRLLKEQDEGLESLLKIVTTQSKIARSINDEVEHHNEILVDIADGMERVDGRINRATELVKVIQKKESIWGK